MGIFQNGLPIPPPVPHYIPAGLVASFRAASGRVKLLSKISRVVGRGQFALSKTLWDSPVRDIFPANRSGRYNQTPFSRVRVKQNPGIL